MAQLFALPKQSPLASGAVLPGAKAYFYVTGTTTPQAVYEDSALSAAHSNPVVADAAGVFPAIYLDESKSYKLTLTDADDVLQYTVDPVNGALTVGAIGVVLHPRTPEEITAAVTPSNYAIPSHTSLGYELASRYGCDLAASAATNKTAIDSAFAVVKALGGGYVVLPNGVITVSDQILIPNCPNGAGLMGQGPAATTLKAANSFNATSLVRNEDTDGTQEYAFLEKLCLDGNSSGGAVCSTAVVDFASLFVNSYIRDCIIARGSHNNLRIWANDGSGPILVDNTWVVSATQNNIVIGAEATSTNAMTGIHIRNCTVEHQGGGYAGIYIDGNTKLSDVSITDVHIEQANAATAGTKSIHLVNCSDFSLNGGQILSASSSYGGIVIDNEAQNVRFKFERIRNLNAISTIIDDQKNSVQFGAVDVPFYAAPEFGIHQDRTQTLTYGASVATNMALGNYCILVATNTDAFTIASPTNGQVGETLTYEITNASGGSMGTITWGGDFDYMDGSWTNPANGYRRLIQFKCRQAGSWAQVAPATGDM